MEYRHELVLPNDDIPFRIFCFEGKEGNYSVAKHWHQWIELFLVRTGEIAFAINTKEYTLKAGDCILVNSNEVHSINAPTANEVVVVQIPVLMMERYIRNHGITFRQIFETGDKYIVEKLESMYEAYMAKKPLYEYKVLSEYYALVYHLLASYMDENAVAIRVKHNKTMGKFAKVTQYIEENYTKELSLEDLSKRFGFSLAYLSRLFKKCANINYKEFVDSVRLEHAYKELLNTDHTAANIAFDNGFPNNKAFINAFKKQYGCTPGQYRKRFHENKL